VSNIFQQTAITVIGGWLAGGTDKNHIKSYNQPPKLLCNFIVDTQFTYVAVGRVSQPGELRVGTHGLDRNPECSFQLAFVKGVHKSNKIY
jgi:hypothetical protein